MKRIGRRTFSWTALAGVVGSVVLGTAFVRPAGAVPSSTTERVSIGTAGEQGNDMSGRYAGPAIDADGTVVAFDSVATTLVPGDTNRDADVFVRDRTTDTIERVSVRSNGAQANGLSTRPALDGTGNLVAFDSSATNLVPGDTNQALDVFLHNRTTDRTLRVSVSSDEAQGTGSSNSPAIGGRFVSFVSSSSNLVPGDTNGVEDIFVRDLAAGTTERVSVTSTGVQANSSSTAASISATGRYVVFSSFASNLVPGDTNGSFDSFIHDRQTGVTERVSVSSDEVQGDNTSVTPTVSRNGRFVAFWSIATNLVPGDTNDRMDIFVRDRTLGTTERDSVSSDEQQADGNSQDPGVRGFTASGPDITADGRYVTFFASATNLVPGDTNTCPDVFQDPGTCPDAFVRDRLAGTTTRVSLFADGSQSNDRSSDPVISDDGLVVAFWSAGNLVPEDTNTCPGFTEFLGNCPDIFVRDGGAAT
jgi:archaellum component FlaF (FlaF/FlaG flagellin family)